MSHESNSLAQRSICLAVTLSGSPISVARIRASWFPEDHNCSASLWFLPMRRDSPCKTGCEIPYAFGTLTPKYAILARTLGLASLFNSRRTLVRLQRSALCLREELLKRLVRVEEDCERAFIDQLHRHHRLKNSSGYGNAKRAQGLIEFLV